ncbi:MAG: SHOCT domain-containing protein [Candidatus Kariarchaeaceae archaeon]
MDSYSVVTRINQALLAGFILFIILGVIFSPTDDPSTPQNEEEEDSRYNFTVAAGGTIMLLSLVFVPVFFVMRHNRKKQQTNMYHQPYQQPYYQQPQQPPQHVQQPYQQPYEPGPTKPPYVQQHAPVQPQQQPAHSDDRSPLEILQTRYAKGEIGKDQYEAMKKELSDPVSEPTITTNQEDSTVTIDTPTVPNQLVTFRFCEICGAKHSGTRDKFCKQCGSSLPE